MDAACPTCGAPVEARQEYCLRCGCRVLPPPRRRRVPPWLLASLGALVVAAGSAAVAIAATRDGRERGTRTIVALSTLRPPSAARAEKPASKPARRAAKPKRHGALVTWPARDGYTVVLASIPTRAGIAQARAVAEQAVARKLPDVGVLVSARYASLHPGYYLVFSGVYSSIEEAQGQLTIARARFPDAYPREISR